MIEAVDVGEPNAYINERPTTPDFLSCTVTQSDPITWILPPSCVSEPASSASSTIAAQGPAESRNSGAGSIVVDVVVTAVAFKPHSESKL